MTPTVAQTFYCAPCGKKFTNEATYNQHLTTKKCQQNCAKAAKGTFKEIPEDKVKRGDPTKDNRVCLFSNMISDSFEDN